MLNLEDVTLPFQELNKREICGNRFLWKTRGFLQNFLLPCCRFTHFDLTWFDQVEGFGICPQISSVCRYGGAVDWPHCEASTDEQQRNSPDTSRCASLGDGPQDLEWRDDHQAMVRLCSDVELQNGTLK